MFDLTIDTSAFEKRAKELDAQIDQVPYALALAMNAAAKKTKQTLVEDTWPSHVTQRNKSFIGRALQRTYANKRNLQIEIYDSLGRAHLKLHDTGAPRLPEVVSPSRRPVPSSAERVGFARASGPTRLSSTRQSAHSGSRIEVSS
jgi:hypothetical protein